MGLYSVEDAFDHIDDLTGFVLALDEVFGGAFGQGALGVILGGEVGEHKNGDRFGGGVGLEPVEDLDAVEFGHHDIEKNEVRAGRGDFGQGHFAVFGDVYGVVFQSEDFLVETDHQRIVFYEEYSGHDLLYT